MPGGGREIGPHGTGPSGRPRRVNRKAAIHRALREKYLHSRAAALHEEGIYDKAIADLQAALAVEERHYTRYQLALAYAARNELQMALSEAGRAIDLAPSVAEYWYQRSVIRRQAGDEHGAEADQALVLQAVRAAGGR